MNDFDFSCFTDGFGDFNGNGKIENPNSHFLPILVVMIRPMMTMIFSQTMTY